MKVQLSKANPDGSDEFISPVLRHPQATLMQAHEINGALDEAFPKMLEMLEKWTHRGSGWVVDRVELLWLDIAWYQPLRGGSYIPLPMAVRNKLAVVNVKNKDDHCLRWVLQSALFPADDHTDRPSKYPTDDGLNFSGIDALTPISQILKVERQNSLAINVFGWDKDVIVHQLSKQPGEIPRINLLMISKAGKYHYTWIKDLNRLLYDQSKHAGGKHFCERCLHGYSRSDRLEAHKADCRGVGKTAARVEMPKDGENKLAFQNWHKQMPAPCVIYADFEALTKKIEGPGLDPGKSNTQRMQDHEACSFCYIMVRCNDQTEPPVEYRSPNTAKRFIRALLKEEAAFAEKDSHPNGPENDSGRPGRPQSCQRLPYLRQTPRARG